MAYVVPKMKLIPQDKKMSCWYASGMMLIEWRRQTKMMSEAAHPDPSQVEKWQKLYRKDTGITNSKILSFAKDLGLKAIPPMSPSIATLTRWLRVYGPLWTNGSRHITVIAGIRGSGAETEVLVYDPAARTKTRGEWRGLVKWYVGNAHSGRDSSGSVRTVFLHAP